jgi:hypothetical protein
MSLVQAHHDMGTLVGPCSLVARRDSESVFSCGPERLGEDVDIAAETSRVSLELNMSSLGAENSMNMYEQCMQKINKNQTIP